MTRAPKLGCTEATGSAADRKDRPSRHGPFPPGAIVCRRTPSTWREFKFALNQVVRAIEPGYSVAEMIQQVAHNLQVAGSASENQDQPS